MQENEILTHEQIVEFLPQALRNAIASYQLFAERDPPQEAKEFKGHHDACKVAISHIELLVKLAKGADLQDISNVSDAKVRELSDVLLNARAEIGKYKEFDIS